MDRNDAAPPSFHAISPPQLVHQMREDDHQPERGIDANIVESQPLLWGAQVLREKYGQQVARVSESVGGLDKKSVITRVRAAAEAVICSQTHSLDVIVKHCQDMVNLRQWRAIAFLDRVAYDETKMDVRVHFNNEGPSSRETAAVFAIEQSWAIVVEVLPCSLTQRRDDRSTFTIFEGNYSTSIRCSQGTTGELIAGVLSSVAQPPPSI